MPASSAPTSCSTGSQPRSSDVVNVDKLTYAGNAENLAAVADDRRATSSCRADICDQAAMAALLAEHRPRAVVHFAAESHVDRSIDGPAAFIADQHRRHLHAARGGARLLERRWTSAAAAAFRFLHVSTDEVYGSLGAERPAVQRDDALRAEQPVLGVEGGVATTWCAPITTPTACRSLTTNCSNNYGPYQFPEKLIPLMISNALEGKPLPVYGDGRQRARLAVRRRPLRGDPPRARARHARARPTTSAAGTRRPTSRSCTRSARCSTRLRPKAVAAATVDQISYVKDRPGHDRRYAIDARKIERELGWRPAETFETGLEKTVRWYLDHGDWVANVQAGSYRDWIARTTARR